LGVPDMRLPIQFALTYPARSPSPSAPLDLLSCGELSFSAPDLDAFPALRLAMDAAKTGGTACPILNGANEAAVALYLQDRIGFYDISDSVAYALDRLGSSPTNDLDTILDADRRAREAVASYFSDR
ncbi:MAG: 1-deoxy-D-xylulose-5-phosphate reductoisomerase, partial [Oscillospiraceae bacterium]|nr:1-deoxy-D-xylulose-5-phosphate reductoisomerase [Oscillospiraceae bacterium]